MRSPPVQLAALVLLAVPLRAGAQEPPPENPAPAAVEEAALEVEHPPCRTCAGTGVAERECWLCAGSGDGPCPQCCRFLGIPTWLDRQIALYEALRPERAAELWVHRAVLASDQEKLAAAGNPFGLVQEPGRVRCPAGCQSGRHVFRENAKCKPCRGDGTVKCSTCRARGEVDCYRCDGEGEGEAVCPECSGARVAPDPLRRTADAATCPWCADRRVLPCRACAATGQTERPCAPCLGDGRAPCEACAGTEDAPCSRCKGVGEVVEQGRGSPSRCDACRGRGTEDCTACEKGEQDCQVCAGTGRRKGDCERCFNELQALCEGCGAGAERAWLVTGERLRDAGRLAEAEAHLAVALERMQTRQRLAEKRFVGEASELRRLERAHRRERFALERDLDDVRKELEE